MEPEPPATCPALWPAWAPAWSRRPRAERDRWLLALARATTQAWQAGAALDQIPFAAWGFLDTPHGPAARLPTSLLHPSRAPLSPPRFRQVLAGWFEETRPHVSARDALRFLHLVLPGLARRARHYQARAIIRGAQALARARAAGLYAGYLQETARPPAHAVHACWRPNPARPPDEVWELIRSALAAPTARRLKAGRAMQVFRAELDGQAVIVKCHAPARLSWWSRVRRPARARRAWAAARTLEALAIPTPEPLGYAECNDAEGRVTAVVVTRFIAPGQSAFQWLRRHYRHLDAEGRRHAGRAFLAALTRLYDAGIYHGDTKLTNLILDPAADESARWLWTDLESVEAGRRLTRRRLLRNLIQLNGSARHWATDEERIALLHALAQRHSWLARRRVVTAIRRRTRQRLLRELTGATPPDGRPAG